MLYLTHDLIHLELDEVDILSVVQYPLYYNEGCPYLVIPGTRLDIDTEYKVNLDRHIATTMGLTSFVHTGDSKDYRRCTIQGSKDTTKIKGITFDRKRSKWVVQKMVGGKRFIKRVDTRDQAIVYLDKLLKDLRA